MRTSESPPRDGAPPDVAALRDVVAELALQSIRQIAPAERALFVAQRDALLARPGVQPDRVKDSPLGFGGGLGPLMSPEVVLAAWVAVQAVAALLTEAAKDAAKDLLADSLVALVRRAFQRRPSAPAPDPDLPADDDLVRCVRGALERHFQDRGLPATDASIITESLVERLLPSRTSSAGGEARS